MMLKSLHIQHYKSLADVDLRFGPITLLVGPNGAGKSNVVDTLRFLKDVFTYGLDHAVHERSGIDVLRQYSATRPYQISLKVEFDYELEKKTHVATYSLKIGSRKGEYVVVEEGGQWIRADYKLIDDDITFDEKKIRFFRDRQGRVTINEKEQQRLASADQIAVDKMAGIGPGHAMSQLRFASIYPNIMREPSRPDSDKRLKENCSNWASIIRSMRQRKAGEQSLQRIMEFMRRVMPNLEQVTVKSVGGYLVPQFLVKDKSGSKSHYFDPVQLSDGTLRIFGLLLSIYQQPPPPFLGLEEPEQTIQPGLLGMLAEAFREVSERTQLLITTHSPYFLDYFTPEEIRVVTLENGETRISSMHASQVEVIKQDLMKMSEIMVLDGLRPEMES